MKPGRQWASLRAWPPPLLRGIVILAALSWCHSQESVGHAAAQGQAAWGTQEDSSQSGLDLPSPGLGAEGVPEYVTVEQCLGLRRELPLEPLHAQSGTPAKARTPRPPSPQRRLSLGKRWKRAGDRGRQALPRPQPLLPLTTPFTRPGSRRLRLSPTDLSFLLKAKAAWGSSFKQRSTWYKGSPLLFGVTTSASGSVISLDLTDAGLQGLLPTALAELRGLTSLFLGVNWLNGSISNSLGKLSQLRILELRDNLFQGSIPRNLGFMLKLRTLNLRGNRLSGSLPAELSKLKEVQHLIFGGNQIGGGIPTSFGVLSTLRTL